MQRLRVLIMVGSLLASFLAHAELSDAGVRRTTNTYAVRQGYQELATFATHESCEVDAQRRTTNAGAVRRIFQHRTGGGAVISTLPSMAECLAAPVTRLTEEGARRPIPPNERESNINSCVVLTSFSTSFQPPTCVATHNFAASYIVTSTPAPTCPPAPAPRAGECPSGTYGAWLSLPIVGPAPACVVTWSPPLAGTCKPIPSCDAPLPGQATLTWAPPTRNTDGSALTDLAGYRVMFGTSPAAPTQTIQVANASATGYTVTGLAPGTYYFFARAYTVGGAESANSNTVSRTVR